MVIFRRIFALFLCTVLLAGLCACEEEKKKSSPKDSNSDISSEKDPEISSEPDSTESTFDHSNDYWYNEEGLEAPPLTVPDEAPEAVVEEFISAMQSGDWATVTQRLSGYAFSGENAIGVPEGGVLEKIMQTMTVTDIMVTDQGDGTYRATMTVEAVDLREVIEGVPSRAASTDAAKWEMLKMVDTASRKQFSAELIILRYRENGRYFIEFETSFINAITGGYYDLCKEVMEGATVQ